jgi:hypothetical protein
MPVPEPELPAEVIRLIHDSVPTVDALEILVTLACSPDAIWSAAALHARIPRVSEPTMGLYLKELAGQGIVAAEPGGFRYRPASPAIEGAVSGLCQAYNARPVTLIRTVYSTADKRQIQSFADAFRLKKEE